jgi:hypothetical protein
MKRILLILAVLAPGLLPASGADSVPPAAAKFLQLFQDLREADAQKIPAARHHVSFQIYANEINEYMRYALRVNPRPGIDSMQVKIFAHNYVSTFTVIDFDAVERWKAGTIPALLRPILRGKKSVWIDYRFQAANSMVSFSVEKAYYNDIRLPAFLVQEMIRIIAARQPEKYDTSKPLPLPFGLRRVSTADQVVMGEN